eukprot:218647_1
MTHFRSKGNYKEKTRTKNKHKKQRQQLNTMNDYAEGNDYTDILYESEFIQVTYLVCRNYGSARGCRYGYNCYYSHSNPESVQICKFIQDNIECRAGNKCPYRHVIYHYEKQSSELTLTVQILFKLVIEYYKHRKTDKIRYSAFWKDKRNKNEEYSYKCVQPKKLFSYLLNNNGHELMAEIGLFVEKKSFYSNNNWHKWIKQENKKYLLLSKNEQTEIIIKIRELINYYNSNYKYMTNKFHPWSYYKTQIIVYGYINHLIRNKLQYIQYCAVEIMKLCFKFYFNISKYELFDYTSTVKISDDNTFIQTKRRLMDINSLCLPFVVYKIRYFKFFKIKCVCIPKHFTFSIGIVHKLSHVTNVKKQKNMQFWPFDIIENEKQIQFWFGNENDKRLSMNEKSLYCGSLCDGDVLMLETPKRAYNRNEKKWQSKYSLMVTSTYLNKKYDQKKVYNLWNDCYVDGYPAIAFDFCVEQETQIEILNVECL